MNKIPVVVEAKIQGIFSGSRGQINASFSFCTRKRDRNPLLAEVRHSPYTAAKIMD